MRIFLAGATGAVGRQLVPMLLDAGHDVVAMTRTPAKAAPLREAGALPVVADGLDREAVMGAVLGAEPEVVIHQMTALDTINPRRFDQDFAQTNRLRREGTDHLLAAAALAGARRFIAQSYAGWPLAREGAAVKDEDAPLDDHPSKQQRRTLAAIRHLEATVTSTSGIEGVVLRYGSFYGPGTSLATDGGDVVDLIRRRRFPVVGSGAGVWSFCHIEDAAGATVRALDHGAPGIYNIVDDRPAPVAEWLPELARIVGAPPPRHVPTWLGRLASGSAGVALMTQVRGASNAKAKRELGWTPLHPDWRAGFREVASADRGLRV